MATVYVHVNYIVVIGFNKCSAYDIRNRDAITCHIPLVTDYSVGDVNRKNNGSDQILAASFSTSGKLFAASNDHKQLTVWDVGSGWKEVNTRTIPRRATALVFTSCDENILVADKAGDVHQFVVFDATGSANLIVGHVSMLLDVKLCLNDRFLVTCDRDEKIRVSCYPNTYNIQSFCLGHTDFVSRLAYVEDCNLLLSGSGDGTIKLWNYLEGELLDTADCRSIVRQASDESKLDGCLEVDNSSEPTGATEICCLACKGRGFAVAFYRQPVVLLFAVTSNDSGTFRISFRHLLSLSAPVWDVAFVDNRHLVVLQAVEGASLIAFAFDDCHTMTEVSPLTDDAGDDDVDLMLTLRQISSDAELLKLAEAASSVFPILRKAHIDNMADYIEKKKQLVKNKTLNDDSSVTDDGSTKKQRLIS